MGERFPMSANGSVDDADLISERRDQLVVTGGAP